MGGTSPSIDVIVELYVKKLLQQCYSNWRENSLCRKSNNPLFLSPRGLWLVLACQHLIFVHIPLIPLIVINSARVCTLEIEMPDKAELDLWPEQKAVFLLLYSKKPNVLFGLIYAFIPYFCIGRGIPERGCSCRSNSTFNQQRWLLWYKCQPCSLRAEYVELCIYYIYTGP